jgi:hypothetical protein
MRNNFQRLEEKKLSEMEPVPGQVRENIYGTRDLFSFIGNVLDLFIPKLFGMLTQLLSGPGQTNTPSRPENKYPNKDSGS